MPSLTAPLNAAVPPVTADGGHGAPSGATGNGSAGSSFAEILSQATGQSPGVVNHGKHGGSSGNSPHGVSRNPIIPSRGKRIFPTHF